MSGHWEPPTRGRRSALLAGVFAVVALLGLATPAFACSTDGLTVEEVGAAARLIVVADVLDAPNGGRNYRLRVVEVVYGTVDAAGELTIGPTSGTAGPWERSCWLSLPVGKRVVLALTDRNNLNALASYAWWDEGGHISSASAVVSWPDTVPALVARLRAGAAIPATDTLNTGSDRPSRTTSPSPVAVGLVVAAGALAFAAAWDRTKRRAKPTTCNRANR